MPSFYKNFTGSVDAFLLHCSKLDGDKVEAMVEDKSDDPLSPEECRALIMEDMRVNEEEAEKIRLQIVEAEIKEVCDSLVEKGFLEVAEYDKEGNPCYQATELGKKARKWS